MSNNTEKNTPDNPKRSLRSFIGMTILCGLAAGYFFLLNPADSTFFWTCPFHEMTGFYCPGCGGQRALHALLHLEFRESLRLNPLVLLLCLPLAVYSYIAYALKALGHPLLPLPLLPSNRPWWIAVLFFLLLFGIGRNL